MTTEDAWTRADITVLLCGGNQHAVRQRACDRAISPELVVHACQRALDIQSQSGEDPPSFEQWEATPPGCLDVRVFDQDQYWVDALRIPHRISDPHDMTDDYLHTLIGFLVDHAAHFLRGYTDYQPVEAHEPRQWLESTVLVRGLRAEMRCRAS